MSNRFRTTEKGLKDSQMNTLTYIQPGKLATTMNSPALTDAQNKIRKALLDGHSIPLSSSGDVTGHAGRPNLTIPPGKLAAPVDNAALTEAQRRIREALLRGRSIPLGPSGDVTGCRERLNLTIPPGKLAAPGDNAALTEAQRRIREALLRGRSIPLGPSGDVTGCRERLNLTIPPGKLAYQHWYEREPERLEAEVDSMKMSFPQFMLDKRPDGKLSWTGVLRPGLLGDNGWDWHLEAVYENNHPHAIMGSSVLVYLRQPDINMLIDATGWCPHHLISGKEGLYLCTTRAEDMHVGGSGMETSASTVLRWAVKWLAAYELVLAGKMTQEEFDAEDGI